MLLLLRYCMGSCCGDAGMISDDGLTNAMFEFQKTSIVSELGITYQKYYFFMHTIKREMGSWKEKGTYAGPGVIGDLIVPDLCFSFPAYCHDGLCKAIENGTDITKEEADSFFLASMHAKCKMCSSKGVECNGLPELYYNSVKNFNMHRVGLEPTTLPV